MTTFFALFVQIDFFKDVFYYGITCSAAYKKEEDKVKELCMAVLNDMYCLSDRRKQLGLGEQVS